MPLFIRKRIILIFVIVCAILAVLFGRITYVQLIQGTWLTEKAKDLWQRDIVFSPPRGRILDRNGKSLVYNISVPSLLAIPAQIKDPVMTAKKLAPILQTDEAKLYKDITTKQMLMWLKPSGKKISEEKAMAIRALSLPGIVITDDSQRYYPYGKLASHLLGFTGIDNQGLAGLELIYEKTLHGKTGYVSFSSDAKGKEIPGGEESFKPPAKGLDLQLTLDKEIQAIMERELDQAVAQYQPDNVIAIAMHPKTGEILGMSSRPTFHPDQYKHTDSKIYNRNLPIWMTFEPGSTAKVVTLAAALEEKKVDLKEHFFDGGSVAVGGAKLRCWKAGGHGSQTFREVVQNSCNPGFVAMGQRLGKEKLFAYLRNFGFGEKTGVDLNGEASGIMFKESQVGPVELATTAFGQGISMTPIQQVAAVSACINGGELVQPHVAKAWIDQQTDEVVEEVPIKVKRRVISPETSKTVCQVLEHVVAQGTGRKAFVDGCRIGGKTGTAQKVGPDGRYMVNNHIVSFIGVAPANDPQIVVYIAVDNPKGIQFGGVVAAPIAGNILRDALSYLGVPRDPGNQVPPVDNVLNVPYIAVPDFIGQNIDKIKSSLHDFPLNIYGTGDVVLDQMPKAGENITKGTPVHLYLTD